MIKKIGILLGIIILFVVYTNVVAPTPWPHLVARWCGDVVGADVCRATYTWYFWLYAGYALAYLWLVVRGREFLRSTALLLLAYGLFAAVEPFTFSELSHIQTYTYEVFIVGFYNWMAWMVMALAACLLWPDKRSRILKATAALTFLMTILFALKGRGSVEHINPLIGGLIKERSFAMLRQGSLWKLFVLIPAAVLAYNPIHNLVHWILRGTLDAEVWKRNARLAAMFLAFALLPILSLPVGMGLNRLDVSEAKTYVDKLKPKLEAYYKEHKQYPETLEKIGAPLDRVPRLLDVYNYIAYGTKDGFYLSKPEKYCFIFSNPGKDFGYWSVTSLRPWQLSRPEESLEKSFQAVCDENKDDVQQQLIAGHLGMPDPNDPVTALGVAGGESMPMQRQTQAMTPELQHAIDELGYKDPSIYFKPPPVPKDAVLSPEQLLEELKKQPLRQD